MAVMLETTSLVPVAASDEELIDAARDGNDRAFEELYARYHERISAFILSRIRDHGRAEDIAQEVFMSALRRLRTTDQSIAFKPWIYETAKNACIDEFRRGRRAREVSLDADEELTGGPRALRAIAATPAAALEGKQRLDDLRGAFGGLSENHHKLLVMREFEGLSYDEIGRRTGMSRSMVESALFRARRKLTDEYEELASGRRCQQVQVAIADGRAQSARTLGVRERRQLARHLAHCQPCRTVARLAGVDESLVKPRSVAAKIAALLPFPLPLWRWPSGDGTRARNAIVRGGAHPVVQQAQAATDSAAPATSAGGAAVAAAVIALAGAGAAVVSAVAHRAHSNRAPADHGVVVTRRAASPRRVSSAAGVVSHSSTQRQRHPATPRAHRAISAAGHAPRAGTKTTTTSHTTSSAPGGAPSAGSTLQTVSRAGSSASSVAKTTSGIASQATSGATSTVHHAVNTVTGAVGSTTSSLNSTLQSTTSSVNSTLQSTTSSVNNTLKSTVSTLGSTTSQLTSPTGSSAPAGSTSSTSTTPNSPLSTATGTVTQVVSGLVHWLAPALA